MKSAESDGILMKTSDNKRVHTGENADISNLMEDVLAKYDNIKEQRNRLLKLLTLWTNGPKQGTLELKSMKMTWLYRDSQELIRKINEQISPEDV